MKPARRLVLLSAIAGASGAAGAFSDAQRRWIAQAPALRFAPEADYGPFVYAGADGRVRGLSIDLLDLMVAATGLKLGPLPPQPLAGILDGLRRGEIDFTSSLGPTPERGAYLLFTRPYVEIPAVLAVRSDRPVRALAALDGRRVAVGAGYGVETHVRRRYPRVAWVAVPGDSDGIAGVQDGHFEAVVLDLASLAFVTQTQRLRPLRVVEGVGFDYDLSFGVRKDLPMLVDVLDAALRSVPAARREAVVERWLGPYAAELATPTSQRGVGIGAGLIGAAALLGAASWWRTRRRRQLAAAPAG